MISDIDLKHWLQRDLTRADKALLVVSSFGEPARICDIKAKAEGVGLKMTNWNLTDLLAKAKCTTIRLPTGYEVSEKGRARLHDLGVTKWGPEAQKVAHDLRTHINTVRDALTKAFVEEAIRCFEFGLYRSAIVMSWLAAVGVLQREVFINHLAVFNAEIRRTDPKSKAVATIDDFGKIKESDFLDRLVATSIIGKNVKIELKRALDLRNGCGHPNSLKVGANAAAAHLELLLQNVFSKFSV